MVRRRRLRRGRVRRARRLSVRRRRAPPHGAARAVRARRATVRLRRLRRAVGVVPRVRLHLRASGAPRFSRGCARTRRVFVDRFADVRRQRGARTRPAARRVVAARIRVPRARRAARADRDASSRPSARTSPRSRRCAATSASSKIATTNRIPKTVAAEITRRGRRRSSRSSRVSTTPGWKRAGIYNYPEPAPRTVEWIATHTVHELFHHRRDITARPRWIRARRVQATSAWWTAHALYSVA